MARIRNRVLPRSLDSFPPVFAQIVDIVQLREHAVECSSSGEAYGTQLEFYRYIASVRANHPEGSEERRAVDTVMISRNGPTLVFRSRLTSKYASALERSLKDAGGTPDAGEALLKSLTKSLGSAENPYYRKDEE